ncbi:MAG: hypothetical protein J6A89_07640 [Clostridia bacterium]|nr:hypothetical protein [Clostridia bacterium]
MEKFEHRLKLIEHRQEQLSLLLEDKEGVEEGLVKIKNILETSDILSEFNQEVFDALIDYIIVGGYDEKGNRDPYIIRFVLKREFNLRHRKEIPEEFIIKNNKVDLSAKNVSKYKTVFLLLKR